LEEIGRQEDNLVVEGRTAYHFIPHSLKIFLEVNEEEGAKRIFDDFKINKMRNEARQVKSIEEAAAINRERMASDTKRYREIYGIDVFNPRNFDFVLDTTGLSKEKEFEQVYNFVKSKLG